MADLISNNKQGKTSDSEYVKATLDDIQSETEIMDPSEDGATNVSDGDSDDASNGDEEDPCDDEHCQKSSLHIRCKCKGNLFTTPNECWLWRCSNDDCKHEVCGDCREVDDNGIMTYSLDHEGDEFVIQDPAADQCVVVKKLRGPLNL